MDQEAETRGENELKAEKEEEEKEEEEDEEEEEDFGPLADPSQEVRVEMQCCLLFESRC